MRDPARTKAAARTRYTNYLQQTLSFVTLAVWRVVPVPRQEGVYSLDHSEETIPLRRGKGFAPLSLAARQLFAYHHDTENTGDWRCRTLGYAYTVFEGTDLSRELLAWHWHPSSRPDTHLHVGKGHPDLSGLSHKAHVPTGRVSLEEVVAFLIRDLMVEPQRDDYEAILDDTLTRFKTYRHWA